MPTLTRLLLALIILIALIYGAMVGLVYLVKPVTTDITINIAPENLHLHDRPSAPQPAGVLQPNNAQQSNNTQLDDQKNNQQPVNPPANSPNSPKKAAAPVTKKGEK